LPLAAENVTALPRKHADLTYDRAPLKLALYHVFRMNGQLTLKAITVADCSRQLAVNCSYLAT
jgi:hypothetical protein